MDPNGDSEPARSAASSLTGWACGSRVGQPLSTYFLNVSHDIILTLGGRTRANGR